MGLKRSRKEKKPLTLEQKNKQLLRWFWLACIAWAITLYLQNMDKFRNEGLQSTATENVESDDKTLKKLDSHGNTILHSAASHNQHESLALLLEQEKIDVDSRNAEQATALMLAITNDVKGDHLGVVEYLVQQGADVNAKDKFGFTPLHHAVANNNLIMVQWLVEHGADIHSAAMDGFNVMQRAAQDGSLELYDWLRQAEEAEGKITHDTPKKQ